jgi:hypothetical protein
MQNALTVRLKPDTTHDPHRATDCHRVFEFIAAIVFD